MQAHGSSSSSNGSSDPAAEDPELAAALDSFVDWARHGEAGAEVPRLPPLQVGVGVEPGAVLGDYELVRRLGVGGMGVVFEARQRSVAGRRVAVKVLRTFFASERLAKRFQREVSTVAELDHPGIVPIVDARVEGGTPYYVMKFVEGVSLDQLVKKLRRDPTPPEGTAAIRAWIEGTAEASGRDSTSATGGAAWESSYVRWVARLGLQVAEALQYAHERGFVHRDVKPGNLVITPRGRVVLLDFGLATSGDEETITQTGEFLGTLAYASPEQVLGRPVDARADVYSLGATLYELLTLTKPFDAQDRSELLRRIEREDPRRLGSAVPLDLRTIVSCAMGKTPERRYATAGALGQDLRALLAGKPIRARPPGLLARALRWVRGHPLLATAAGVAMLFLLAVRVTANLRAQARVEEGERILAACLADQRDLVHHLDRHAVLRAEDPPDFLALAEERAAIERQRALVESGYDEARNMLLGAFEHVADHGPARRALARLHAEELACALRLYEDVLLPARVARIEKALENFDGTGEHAALLAHTGRVRIDCEADGATLEVLLDPDVSGGSGRPLYTGPAPFAAELEEGSYLARASAPGRAEATLPFLVRRDACYAFPGARPARELEIDLLRDGEIPEGYVYVPGGDTLVADDPPSWTTVAPFLIHRYETTYAEIVRWIEELGYRDRDVARMTPAEGACFPSDSLGAQLVRRSDGGWDVRPDLDPQWPARGISPMALGFYADAVDLLDPSGPPGWYASMPRLEEWIRAARGSDGRAYPWGRTFDRERCVSYLSSGHFGSDARPLEVGARVGDRSPFGVHDMAGSLAEWTADTCGPLPGHFAVCGGSYRNVEPSELACTAVHARPNEVYQDVGFRLVMRPLPDWCRIPERPPAAFADDFERPDDPDPGNGWVELSGIPLGLATNPAEHERVSIEGGRLVCLGGRGDFSESSTALHRIHVPEGGYTVRATLRARCELPPAETLGRYVGIQLARGFRASEREGLILQVPFQGGAELMWSAPGAEPMKTAGPAFPLDGALAFELRVLGERVEGRLWPGEGERPDAPTLAIRVPPGRPVPRYVLIVAPNYVGARVEAEEIRVEPGP